MFMAIDKSCKFCYSKYMIETEKDTSGAWQQEVRDALEVQLVAFSRPSLIESKDAYEERQQRLSKANEHLLNLLGDPAANISETEPQLQVPQTAEERLRATLAAQEAATPAELQAAIEETQEAHQAYITSQERGND